MLTIKISGKQVTTTNNKQVMTINGNDIDIERIGNAIYVNGIPINVIIADKTGVNWSKATGWGILSVSCLVTGFYLIPTYGQVGLDFIATQSTVLIDLVMGYLN